MVLELCVPRLMLFVQVSEGESCRVNVGLDGECPDYVGAWSCACCGRVPNRVMMDGQDVVVECRSSSE